MKKRLFTKVLSVLLLIVMSVFGFVGCGGDGEVVEKTIALDTTTKELVVGDSFTLTATTTPADAQVVWSTSNEAIATVENGTVTAISAGTATVTAQNDTATATCEITVKAKPVVETKEYTVVFKDGNSELKSVKVKEGESVSYNGVLPSKVATEQYSYVFSGWSLSADGEVVDISTVVVDADKTFYAIFAETVREYKVTWNIDGATTDNQVAYGATPAYTGTTPTKPTVGNTSYTFIGWASSLSGEVLDTFPTVTGDVTYYAVFDEVTAQTKFTVTWKNGDTVLKTDVDVEFETLPTYTGDVPTKEMTTEVEYVFAGWATSADGEKLDTLPEVTANVTYYAVFSETARKYAITWVVEGEESETQVAYGSVPAYEGTPVKADSTECSYKFVGWALTVDGEKLDTLPEVSGEATYYAVFDVDTIFESPKFTAGNIMYSVRTQEAFLPEGLLAQGVTLVSAELKIADATNEVGYKRVSAYEDGAWIHSALNTTTVTDEEENVKTVNVEDQNAIIAYTSEIELSNGEKYTVTIEVYAGIIDELSDFPLFFNNEATDAGVAPSTYGYYIVTKDLGDGTDELSFTQCAATDFEKTCGFNGVLNGLGHTLRFKLMSGGLVGMVIGNGAIENLGIIFEDATTTHYGVFGDITNGAPEIRNCYIEKTNIDFTRTTNFGIMYRPNGRLRLHNTVVYGFNVSLDVNAETIKLNETSSNSYVIHARANATDWVMATNYTKVINDGIENGSRELALTEIENVDAFNDAYWSKEDGRLIWKGLEMVTVTWVNGEETTSQTVTKGSVLTVQTLPNGTKTETEIISYYWSESEDGEKVVFAEKPTADATKTYYLVEKRDVRYYTVTWVIDGAQTTTNYEYNATASHDNPVKEDDEDYTYEFKGWSRSENGEVVELGAVTVDGIVYYAVFERTAITTATVVAEPVLYSTGDSKLFLPQEINFTLDATITIISTDEATTYYQNGEWVNTFALSTDEINANAIGYFDVNIIKGTDIYLATVKSYAGVIDELQDFAKFFSTDHDASAYPPPTYGNYVVIKNVGSLEEDLSITCSATPAYNVNKIAGFNGVVDGLGHTVQFNLVKGGLFGSILGNCIIKNLSIVFTDNTPGHYGVFGYWAEQNPEIINCYIAQQANHYQKTTTYGLMNQPWGRLVLKNTVVWGSPFTFTNVAGAGRTNISAKSQNAFVIWAPAATAGDTTVSANFTEVSTSGALTKDLSALDSKYWNTTDNKPSWKAATDNNYTVVAVA